MTTLRQTARDRVLELLNTDRPSDVVEFTRRRYVPGQRLREPLAAVFFIAEKAERIGGKGGPATLRSFSIAVQYVDGVEEPAEADDALEPALKWITQKLGKTNLDGLVHDIEQTGTVWETDPRDLFYIAATTTWRIEYQSLRDDLTRRS